MREALSKDSAVSPKTAANMLPNLAASESASGGPSPQTSRNPTASAYMHIPVHITITQDQSATRSQAEFNARWYLPPQEVCKEGAKPTPVCGRWSKDLNDPAKKPKNKDAGPFKCPRCHYGYSKVEGVRKHFPKCVALNGNPRCDAWTDHHSYDAGAATRRQVQSIASKGYADREKWPHSSRADRYWRVDHTCRSASRMEFRWSRTC